MLALPKIKSRPDQLYTAFFGSTLGYIKSGPLLYSVFSIFTQWIAICFSVCPGGHESDWKLRIELDKLNT